MSKAKRREQQKRRAAFVATIRDEAGSYWLGEADGCEFGYRRDGVMFEGSISERHEPGSHVLTPTEEAARIDVRAAPETPTDQWRST